MKLTPVHYFEWVCPNCHEKRQHKGITINDPEAIVRLSDDICHETGTVAMVAYPRQVGCLTCSTVYDVEEPAQKTIKGPRPPPEQEEYF